MSNIRNYSVEKADKITRFKAISVTLLIHFGLLYGLFYMNTDHPKDLMPDFVKEWVKGEEVKNAVASQRNLP